MSKVEITVTESLVVDIGAIPKEVVQNQLEAGTMGLGDLTDDTRNITVEAAEIKEWAE